ncbi:hypothetical protein CSUB01_10960 [Colletotrichum sublineola]|uniref:Uncharacterized protein n=1 Tax=Colletotrichum sublineola TaxID=1173701 RepID=A0A066XHL1_COLSU|nr:hypothetical protein CSUB01_10960 [Colletotrichum sublineola]
MYVAPKTKELYHSNLAQRIRSILRPYLNNPNQQACRPLPFSSDPGHIFAFSVDPNREDRIVIHMWSAGSHVVFYDTSHKKPLCGVLAANGLLEIPLASLRKNDCKPIEVRMDKGGSSAILHYRYAFQIKTGFTNAYGLEAPMSWYWRTEFITIPRASRGLY